MAMQGVGMAERETCITDLNMDSLAQCASRLSLEDLSNMAMTCKFFQKVAYSDSVWLRWLRDLWKKDVACGGCGAREAYLGRRRAVLEFKFEDPFAVDIATEETSFDHLLLDTNHIIYSQGQSMQTVDIAKLHRSDLHRCVLNGHSARITCMRLFPLYETSLFRNESKREDNVLVTSSCDHTIRLWWKGVCQRSLRGHTGPVSALSDKLLGDGAQRVLASGGEDGTVRLWSLSSGGKRGQRASKATLYGHVKPIKLMCVAGHKSSLLATVSKDSKVRVWDTSASGSRSSCCVGMSSVVGAPVNMKCHEAMLYIGSGSNVVVLDLRTMQKVMTAGIHSSKMYAFDALPSKSLICTGGNGMAMLWDIRKSGGRVRAVEELSGHEGPVSEVHMDAYKIVTAGRGDLEVKVWESGTGKRTNTLSCGFLEEGRSTAASGCLAVAIDGARIATAAYNHGWGRVRYTNFSDASYPATDPVSAHGFWHRGSDTDDDDEEEEEGDPHQ